MKRRYLESDKLSAVLFWTLWLLYAVVFMTKNCYSAAMAGIVAEGVMTKSQTGLITALFYLVYAPLQVLGGYLADHYKPERLIALGVTGAGAANLIIALCQNYYVMLVVWTLNGIIQFGIWPSVFKIISAQLSAGYRKKGIFYISFAGTVGLLMAYGIAALVSDWRYNFLLSAVSLFAGAAVFGVIYKKISGSMLEIGRWDKRPDHREEPVREILHVDKPFWRSGFYLLVAAAFLCYIIGQGVKTLSPTMLMESYTSISPALGNALNMIIILSGILGTIFVKLVLYPRYIRDELTAYLSAVVISLPFAGVLAFVGKADVAACLVSLAAIAALNSANTLFTSYFNMKFARFAREGEAAGIVNMGNSFGGVVQSYGLAAVAEHFGWRTVSFLWIGMTVLVIVLIVLMRPVWKRFAAKYEL